MLLAAFTRKFLQQEVKGRVRPEPRALWSAQGGRNTECIRGRISADQIIANRRVQKSLCKRGRTGTQRLHCEAFRHFFFAIVLLRLR